MIINCKIITYCKTNKNYISNLWINILLIFLILLIIIIFLIYYINTIFDFYKKNENKELSKYKPYYYKMITLSFAFIGKNDKNSHCKINADSSKENQTTFYIIITDTKSGIIVNECNKTFNKSYSPEKIILLLNKFKSEIIRTY